MVHRFAPTIALAVIALPVALFGLTVGSQPGTARSGGPPAEVTGKPLNCIPLARVRESRIRDERTIDFMTGGHSAFRTVLPARCPGLMASNAFSYETSLSELCSTDIIHVLDTAGGLHRGASCGLGTFVPVKLPTR